MRSTDAKANVGAWSVLRKIHDGCAEGVPHLVVHTGQVDNSDVMVPVVSAPTGLLYCASKDNGDYEYGFDWETGEIKQTWQFPDDSRAWNAFGGITTILDDGDLLIGAHSQSKG